MHINSVIGGINIPCFLDTGSAVLFDSICDKTLEGLEAAGGDISKSISERRFLKDSISATLAVDDCVRELKEYVMAYLEFTDEHGRSCKGWRKLMVIPNLNAHILLGVETVVWDLCCCFRSVRTKGIVRLFPDGEEGEALEMPMVKYNY